MGARAMMPPPPPGFTDDVPPSSGMIPPPPPGFTDDVSSGDDYTQSGLARNAVKNVFRLPKELISAPFQQVKQGLYDFPKEAATSMFQLPGYAAKKVMGEDPGPRPLLPLEKEITNSPVVKTPVRWAYENPVDAAMLAATPFMMWRGATAGAPAAAEAAPETGAASELPVVQPGAKTGEPHALFAYNDDFGPGGAKRSLYNVFGDPEHPVIKARGWGSSVSAEDAKAAGIPITGRQPNSGAHQPIESSAQAPANFEAPNLFEQKGGKGLNAIAGIRGKTVELMTRPGENPGTVGAALAKQMDQEGAIGNTAAETYQKSTQVANKYGQGIQDALNKIKAANKSLGVYPDLEDSLKVQSNPLLKPILDKANDLAKSPYPVDKTTARGWRAMYSSLSQKANANSGFLTLDDLRGEMHKVGSMYDTAGPNHVGTIDQLYSHLADLRDDMVNDIADRVSDPKLASNLLKANAGYSRYMRVLPDIKKAASAESVGQMNLSSMAADIKKSIFNSRPVASTMLKAGDNMRKTGSPFGNAGIVAGPSRIFSMTAAQRSQRDEKR